MRNEKGFATILLVLVLLAVSAAAVGVTVLGSIDRSAGSLSASQGEQALLFAESCLEDALLRARNDEGYEGGDMGMPEGPCAINVEKDGALWAIEAHWQEKYRRSVRAVIERSATGITILEWREI